MKIETTLDIIGTWRCEAGIVRHRARVHLNAFALPRKFEFQGRVLTLTTIEIMNGDTCIEAIYLDRTNGVTLLTGIKSIE